LPAFVLVRAVFARHDFRVGRLEQAGPDAECVYQPHPVPVTPDSPLALINRELSWLSFARRVLALAEDPEQPLRERVKFAGIMGSICDEFAMKRIGGLFRKVQKGDRNAGPRA
jgi:Polyphosphate kinase N-terminal domain